MDTVNKRKRSGFSLDLKEQLRSAYRAKRQALTELQQIEASKQLLNNCLESGLLQGLNSLAVYLANDGEIDPIRLIYYAWANGNVSTCPLSILFIDIRCYLLNTNPQ